MGCSKLSPRVGVVREMERDRRVREGKSEKWKGEGKR